MRNILEKDPWHTSEELLYYLITWKNSEVCHGSLSKIFIIFFNNIKEKNYVSMEIIHITSSFDVCKIKFTNNAPISH